ncbi:hypothetical protein [Phaffia rhodozyma]|uniref:Peroxisomal biogenesis factor 11 n=1 Tax=Phaffia rhodozyma TaxID=264483 RepID=A0A0F7STP8_PHARH|nr:hypothetical protein [Phaffia rhodozyma]
MASLTRFINTTSISDANLAQATRFFSTFGGTDKALMILQYFPLVILPLLPQASATGLAIKPRGTDRLRISLQALSSTVGDSRVLIRLFGLIPILQWIRSIQKRYAARKASNSEINEKKEDVGPKRWLSDENLEAIQALSILAYYPMEHTYYLAMKGVVPLAVPRIVQIARWSCRCWAIYVVLSLVSLRRRYNLLKASDDSPEIKAKQYSSQKLQALVDLSYLPLTVHWSLPDGAWTSSFPTGVFGTLAAIGQIATSWKAVAAP